MDRFWSKVEKTEGCWNWNSALTYKGYGTFWMNGHPRPSHRISFELNGGKIPEGMQVLHRCDNRRCVNPDHLFLGTNADNMADKVAKGRQSRIVVKGEKHYRAKLIAEQVLAIRSSDGRPVDLAAEYSVSPQTIVGIRKRRYWKHI